MMIAHIIIALALALVLQGCSSTGQMGKTRVLHPACIEEVDPASGGKHCLTAIVSAGVKCSLGPGNLGTCMDKPLGGENRCVCEPPDPVPVAPVPVAPALMRFTVGSQRSTTLSLPEEIGGRSVVVPNFSGSVTLESAPTSLSNIDAIEVIAGEITAPSIRLPDGSVTGPNVVTFMGPGRTPGKLNRTTGEFFVSSRARITNDLFPSQRPILIMADIFGMVDMKTGAATFMIETTFVKVDRFTGKAHGVGLGERGGAGITGRFTSGGSIGLGADSATVTITSLFNEAVGAGEVVANLPLTLVADPRNNANVGIFKTPPGSLPIAEITIGALGRGRFNFRLNVSKSTIAVPNECPTTDLTTSFTIDDGVNPPVVVTTEKPWRCFGTGNRYLRTP